MLSQTMHGQRLVYLDSAATSLKPECVIEAERDFYRNHYGTVHRALYELAAYATSHYDAARSQIQRFLHAASAREIIHTRSTTESINLVAYSFGKAFVREGDEILVSELEHHSNIVPWQIMCEDRGGIIRVIPVDDQGQLDMKAYGKLLNRRTKMVAVCHMANATGTINPVAEICRMAHAVGAKVLVDGAQAAAHLLVDVQAIGCDFYAFSGHKVFGPTGVGVLYGKEELLNAMPPYQGGGDMIDQVTFEKTTYNCLPIKFEAGTPMISQVIALGVALQYLEKVGMEVIDAWERDLLNYVTERLQSIQGLRIIGTTPHKGPIVSFWVDGFQPLDIGTLLDLRGVAVRTGHHCAQPTMKRFGVPATTRASFAFYNTRDDIDIFVDALQNIVGGI